MKSMMQFVSQGILALTICSTGVAFGQPGGPPEGGLDGMEMETDATSSTDEVCLALPVAGPNLWDLDATATFSAGVRENYFDQFMNLVEIPDYTIQYSLNVSADNVFGTNSNSGSITLSAGGELSWTTVIDHEVYQASTYVAEALIVGNTAGSFELLGSELSVSNVTGGPQICDQHGED